jgi:hypothetical protein
MELIRVETKPIHYTANQGSSGTVKDYVFVSKEELEEFDIKYNNARLGGCTSGEQSQACDRIYKMILMKRRMRNKLKK